MGIFAAVLRGCLIGRGFGGGRVGGAAAAENEQCLPVAIHAGFPQSRNAEKQNGSGIVV